MEVYERFFNFRTKPFELVPNPDFLYVSRTHKKAMTYLDYGIRQKTGFMLLTGEAGTGKTTLIRDLIKKMNGKVNLSKVFNTKVSSDQLISMINDDFGLDVRGKDKVILLKELYNFLIEQYANGYASILIIDEAQNLNAELLEEVRMLSNLETDRTKLLQIILAGQPELRKTLSKGELRQLRQRISINCRIQPLTRTETEEYILHRLEVAGNRNAVSFAGGAIDAIHGYSKGIPRFVNIVCDFLMLTAYFEKAKELTPDLVKEVVSEIELENTYRTEEPPGQPFPFKADRLKGMEVRLARIEKAVSVQPSPCGKEDFKAVADRLGGIEKMLSAQPFPYGEDHLQGVMGRLARIEKAVSVKPSPCGKEDFKAVADRLGGIEKMLSAQPSSYREDYLKGVIGRLDRIEKIASAQSSLCKENHHDSDADRLKGIEKTVFGIDERLNSYVNTWLHLRDRVDLKRGCL
jgi:putative secretion ATPase (PEP-CTERM system associated)